MVVKRMYSLSEVAELANVTRRTLYSWIDSGYLEAVKIGGRWKVAPETMDRLTAGKLASYKRRKYKTGHPVGFTAAARQAKAKAKSEHTAAGLDGDLDEVLHGLDDDDLDETLASIDAEVEEAAALLASHSLTADTDEHTPPNVR